MAAMRALALVAVVAASVSLAAAQGNYVRATLGNENGGACGFTGALPAGTYVAGFSESLYGKGAVCGACYEVRCVNTPQCKPRTKVVVLVTNECMAKNSSDICAYPNAAINMQPAAYDVISNSRAPGVINVAYKQVPCARPGGIQLMITTGNQYYLAVLIQNVAVGGSLTAVAIRAGMGPWNSMTRSYGNVWEVEGVQVKGQPLSFRLQTTPVLGKPQFLDINSAFPATWKPEKLITSVAQFKIPPPVKKIAAAKKTVVKKAVPGKKALPARKA